MPMAQVALNNLRAALNEDGVNAESLDMENLKRLFKDLCIAKEVPSPIDEKIGIIDSSIGKRFSRYKKILSERCSVSVHYNYKLIKGTDWRQQMRERIGEYVRCEGRPGENCPAHVVLDGSVPWDKAFPKLEFDHNYSEENIADSLTCALKNVVDNHWDSLQDTLKAQTLPILKQVLGKTELHAYSPNVKGNMTDKQNQVTDVVKIYVDLDKIIDDLYGSNISLRCPSCHAAEDQCHKNTHPYEAERYIKKSVSRS